MPSTVLFGEADLEGDCFGESDESCSYPASPRASEISEVRPCEPQALSDARAQAALRVPEPSAELLELSRVSAALEIQDEPLRESREPFRLALLASAAPQGSRASQPPGRIEEALQRAARSSFASQAFVSKGPASQAPAASERPSSVR